MREIGHPTHVFDYDRLLNHTLNIRESKKGEKIRTRYKCTEVKTGKLFLFSAVYEVEMVN